MQTLVYFKRKIKHNYYNITLIFSSQTITQEMLDATKKKSIIRTGVDVIWKQLTKNILDITIFLYKH